MPVTSEAERAYQAGLRSLSHRPRSRLELRQRLSRRFSADAVQEAIARLVEKQYLDDAAFARSWRDSREAHRPRSAFLIRRELRQRGIATEVAEAAVDGLDDEDSAYRAGQRRLRALQGMDEATFRRRLGDYLRRRGFSFSVARGTVERVWREREV